MPETGTSPAVHLRSFTLGPWETNCFIVHTDGSPQCWIVDAGFKPAEMIETIRQMRLQPALLILTHSHLDHIGGVREILEALGPIPLAIHSAEADFLTDPDLNMSSFVQMSVTTPPADQTLEDGQELDLAGSKWRVLHTPGHSPGGITLYHQQSRQAIVGDTLFAGSIGRYDFPTSDGPTLMKSIRDRLLTLPDDTKIYPGHGPTSTIGQERRTNPFLTGDPLPA